MSILIIDYGGSTTGQIPLILSELGISSMTIQPTDPFPTNQQIRGVILSGGPDHVYQLGSRKLPAWIGSINVPVFGICYGMQLIVNHLGGSVFPMINVERGPTLIHSFKDDPLLGRFITRTAWMNHNDSVTNLPSALEVTSFSDNGSIASVNDGKIWWGVQFHPENIVGLDWGREIFHNFIQICIQYQT